MQTKVVTVNRKTKFHSYGVPIKPIVERDLDVIRFLVEEEFGVAVKSKKRFQKYVNVKRVFVGLVLYVYNRNLRELKSPNLVTLVVLAKYLGYRSHASVSLHAVNSHKGNITLEEYLMRDDKLRDRYIKLKVKVGIENAFNFKKFLLAKKQELESELALINHYLKKKEDEEAKEEIQRITEAAL